MTKTQDQGDLFEWANARPSAEIIDLLPIVALRMWQRRQWPRPQSPCGTPIDLQSRRGAA